MPSTSLFRLYLNTLESNVKVKYSIVDHRNEVVIQSEGYESSLIEFSTLQQE